MKPLRPFLFGISFIFLGFFSAIAQERLPQFLQYKVKPGETINYIAEHFNVPLQDLLLLNDFPPNVEVKTNQVVLIRLLKEGEEATPLAADYKDPKGSSSSSKKIVETTGQNENASSERAEVSKNAAASKPETVGPDGTKYKVSESEYHTVQKGQTFYRIALIYGLTVDELKQLNNLSSTTIAVGQKLRVSK